MDWDTAMRRELKRFNAAARRAIAKRESVEVASKQSKPQPTTWDEALKRMLHKARRMQRDPSEPTRRKQSICPSTPNKTPEDQRSITNTSPSRKEYQYVNYQCFAD